MTLIESWRAFKARKPNEFYSYVWWETLLGFYFIIAWLTFAVILLFINNWWIIIIGIGHVIAGMWWDFREIKKRKKYWSDDEQ